MTVAKLLVRTALCTDCMDPTTSFSGCDCSYWGVGWGGAGQILVKEPNLVAYVAKLGYFHVQSIAAIVSTVFWSHI